MTRLSPFVWGIIFSVVLFNGSSLVLAACQHCHTDAKFNEIWKQSTHAQKGVDCNACHVEQNPVKELWSKISGLATFSFSKVHEGSIPRIKNCLKCHQAIARFNVVAKEALPEKLQDIGMIVDHKKHIEIADSCKACHESRKLPANPVFSFIDKKDPMSCASCHNTLAHAKPEKYAVHYPSEEQCGYCHGKNRKCPSLKNISDVKNKSTCNRCHPNQYSL